MAGLRPNTISHLCSDNGGQGLSIDIRNSMQSVRHRHSEVNRGGVVLTLVIVLCTSKLRKNLKGREKAKVKYSRIRMMVTDDIRFFHKK